MDILFFSNQLLFNHFTAASGFSFIRLSVSVEVFLWKKKINAINFLIASNQVLTKIILHNVRPISMKLIKTGT